MTQMYFVNTMNSVREKQMLTSAINIVFLIEQTSGPRLVRHELVLPHSDSSMII